MFYILDVILKGIITALIVTPMIAWWNARKKRRADLDRQAKYGGRSLVIIKNGNTLASAELDLDEAEAIEIFFLRCEGKGQGKPFSATKLRQFLQSNVSGIGERTDNVLKRLKESNDGEYLIDLSTGT